MTEPKPAKGAVQLIAGFERTCPQLQIPGTQIPALPGQTSTNLLPIPGFVATNYAYARAVTAGQPVRLASLKLTVTYDPSFPQIDSNPRPVTVNGRSGATFSEQIRAFALPGPPDICTAYRVSATGQTYSGEVISAQSP